MLRDEQATLVLRLREATERCIVLLGTGLLRDPVGQRLSERLRADGAELAVYFGQLRLQLLQIVAWMLGEQRAAVPQGTPTSITIYRKWYASERLRSTDGSEKSSAQGPPWQRLQRILKGLWTEDSTIGVAGWGSDLFDPRHSSLLRDLTLSPRETGLLIASIADELVEPCISEPSVGTQLIGHIHEWLMERRAVLDPAGRLTLDGCKGHERRTTGSYFTPTALVEHLLDVCLEPILASRIDADDSVGSVQRLLRLRVVDPACGTGVFLIAAARRIAKLINDVTRASPAARREVGDSALREVVAHCLYGVDVGTTTVTLCRLLLWFECGAPFEPNDALNQHVRCGNSLFGTWPGVESLALLDAAFDPAPGDDVAYARALKRRNRLERKQPAPAGHACALDHSRLLADLWCAVFVWPKREGEAVPTHAHFAAACVDSAAARERWGEPLRALTERHRFFHWQLEFPDVFRAPRESPAESDAGGFDLVVGNPPWVAHAGRSTQHLEPGLKRFFSATYRSFAGFPTTHGVFIELATRLLSRRGRIGLIVPASVADLAGYAPTRAAHDQRCSVLGPLPDYGEGRFTGVTQPCIALVSERRTLVNPEYAAGANNCWVIERSDLDPAGLALLSRMIEHDSFPDDLFGERGFQSTPTLRQFVCRQAQPAGSFTIPLREGTDVREYQLGPANHYADACLVNRALRPPAEFLKVALVVRQTARYPIAARSDGLPFRNSLLAVLGHSQWPWSAMLCILNSGLIRWTHYYRYRDGRQPILPQLKVGHLRSLPAPSARACPEFSQLERMGADLASRNQGVLDAERALIDEWVCSLYRLSPAEQRMICGWHANRPR